LLRSLQEIQPDFEEEAKAYAGLWSQVKKKSKRFPAFYGIWWFITVFTTALYWSLS
jgi:hypothetical protein